MISRACAALLVGWVAGSAMGQESPVIKRLIETGEIRAGYRDSSVPLSYAGKQGEALGFSVDLCTRLVEILAKENRVPSHKIAWSVVTSASRMSAIKDSRVDLECGSTTNTAERRKEVAFTIPHYFAGVRILSKSRNAIASPVALAGRVVSTNKGSTAAEMLDIFAKQIQPPPKILLFSTSAESFAAVRDGKADAWLHDDIQLYSQRALSPNPAEYSISATHLSIEPLAVMLPKNDAALKTAIDKSMRSLMRSGEMHKLYAKWFEQPIPPSGVNLQVPLNFLTRDIYRNPTDYVPDLRIMRLQ